MKIYRTFYRCKSGHEFIEDVVWDGFGTPPCPWHSYARPSDSYLDKPEGGVCDFCRSSIYAYRNEIVNATLVADAPCFTAGESSSRVVVRAAGQE